MHDVAKMGTFLFGWFGLPICPHEKRNFYVTNPGANTTKIWAEVSCNHCNLSHGAREQTQESTCRPLLLLACILGDLSSG